MTVKEFAVRAQISVRLAYGIVAEKGIAHRRVGLPGRRGLIVIDEDHYLAWVRSTTVPAGHATGHASGTQCPPIPAKSMMNAKTPAQRKALLAGI